MGKCSCGCGGILFASYTNIEEVHNGVKYNISNVPILMCDKCGEKLFHATTMINVEERIENKPEETSFGY